MSGNTTSVPGDYDVSIYDDITTDSTSPAAEDSTPLRYGIIILEIILIICMITSNGLVIIACTVSKSLRTTTHKLIQNMAIFDMLRFTGVSCDLYTIVARIQPSDSLYRIMCIAKINIAIFSAIGSMLTVAALAGIRMVSAQFPHKNFTSRSAGPVITIIWGYTIALCIFFLALGTEEYIEPPCTLVSINKPTFNRILFCHSCLVVLICIISYSRITVILSRNAKKTHNTQKKNSRAFGARERRLTFIMALVVITFIICWSPLTVMILSTPNTRPEITLFWKILTNLTNVYTFLNPIIYVLTMPDFRNYVIKMFSGRCYNNLESSTSVQGTSGGTGGTSGSGASFRAVNRTQSLEPRRDDALRLAVLPSSAYTP